MRSFTNHKHRYLEANYVRKQQHSHFFLHFHCLHTAMTLAIKTSGTVRTSSSSSQKSWPYNIDLSTYMLQGQNALSSFVRYYNKSLPTEGPSNYSSFRSQTPNYFYCFPCRQNDLRQNEASQHSEQDVSI